MRAVRSDPRAAEAHAGLAEAFVLSALLGYMEHGESLQQAKSHALKAVELDELHSEARTSLGIVKMLLDWDMAGAESELKRAVRINPSNVRARQWLAQWNAAARRFKEEFHQVEKALELDPLSLIINTMKGEALRDLGRYDQAITQLVSTIELDPRYPQAHSVLAGVYAETGIYDKWSREYERALNLFGRKELAQLVSEVNDEKGYRKAMRRMAERLAGDTSPPKPAPTEIAAMFVEGGLKSEAMKWLERASQTQDPLLVFLNARRISPIVPWKTSWHEVRSDPAFKKLQQRVGLLSVM